MCERMSVPQGFGFLQIASKCLLNFRSSSPLGMKYKIARYDEQTDLKWTKFQRIEMSNGFTFLTIYREL